MEKIPTEWDWTVFGEVVQKRKGIRQVAEEQESTPETVIESLKFWHKFHPELFPVESERAHLRHHVSFSRRKRENLEVTSYDSAEKDGSNPCDNEIRHKF